MMRPLTRFNNQTANDIKFVINERINKSFSCLYARFMPEHSVSIL